MNIWQKIFYAGAKLFGPQVVSHRDGCPDSIDEASVVAALVALGAKMAKADGSVSKSEVDAFKKVFQASPENEETIARFFNLARQSTLGYEKYAKIIYKRFRFNPSILEGVLDGLFHIAMADGIVMNSEISFLERVASEFGLSDSVFSRIKATNLGRAADDPYLILGIDESISDLELKSAYRRMASACHPDTMMARGLPIELVGLANHKMAMVNKAYSELLSQRSDD